MPLFGSFINSFFARALIPAFRIQGPSNVNEGQTSNFLITSTYPNGTNIYWSVVVAGADISPTSGTVTTSSGSATIPITVLGDYLQEGTETFDLIVRLDNSNGRVLSRLNNITINDTSVPIYTITPSAASVNEGQSISFTVDVETGQPSGTTLYWTIEASSGDFLTASGSFNITGAPEVLLRSGSFSVTPIADATTEGAETFYVAVRTGSTSGSIAAISNNITINDTSLDPTYSIAPSGNPNVNEGSSITMIVNTTNVPDFTTLYWTVTSAADFATSSGSFTIISNGASFTVSPTADQTTEGAETFTVSVRTGSVNGFVVATSTAITINDTSIAPTATINPEYSDIDEGESLYVNVLTTNIPDGTTLYWTVSESTDFTTNSGSFQINANGGAFSITPTLDATAESAEIFTISVRTQSVSGPIISTSSPITINDAYVYSRLITPNSVVDDPVGAINNNGRTLVSFTTTSDISSNKSLVALVYNDRGAEQLGYRINMFNTNETVANRSCFVTSTNNFVVGGELSLSGSTKKAYLSEINSTSSVSTNVVLSHQTYDLAQSLFCKGEGDDIYVASVTSAPNGTPGISLIKIVGPIPDLIVGIGSVSISWAKKIQPQTGNTFELRSLAYNPVSDQIFLSYKCRNHVGGTGTRNGITPVIWKFDPSNGSLLQYQDMVRSDSNTPPVISVEDQELVLSDFNSQGDFYCNMWRNYTSYSAGEEMSLNRVPNTIDVFGNFGWFDSPGWTRYNYLRGSTVDTKLAYTPSKVLLIEESTGTTGSGTVLYASQMKNPTNLNQTVVLFQGVDDFDGRNKFCYVMRNNLTDDTYSIALPTKWCVFQHPTNKKRIACIVKTSAPSTSIPNLVLKILPEFRTGVSSGFDYLSSQRPVGPYERMSYDPTLMRVGNRTFGRSRYIPSSSDIPIGELTLQTRSSNQSTISNITRTPTVNL
jgi:hypothetical protein